MFIRRIAVLTFSISDLFFLLLFSLDCFATVVSVVFVEQEEDENSANDDNEVFPVEHADELPLPRAVFLEEK
jgi:hypothetical protein